MIIATHAVLALFLWTLCSQGAQARSPRAFDSERGQIERLYSRASTEGAGSGALTELEQFVRNKEYPVGVKSHALRKIGKLSVPAGDNFLLQVSSKPLEYVRDKGEVSTILYEAHRAYFKSSVLQATNPANRRNLLIGALDTNDTGLAIEELCSNGDAESLPRIIEILSRIPSERKKRQIALCESKVRLISKHSARIEALRAALSDKNEEMRLWGLEQLDESKAAAAETALADFVRTNLMSTSKSYSPTVDLSIAILQSKGWEDADFKKHGIQIPAGL